MILEVCNGAVKRQCSEACLHLRDFLLLQFGLWRETFQLKQE
jgi:hypothetical protein